MMKHQIWAVLLGCALVLVWPQLVSAQPELSALEKEIASVLKGHFSAREAFEKLRKIGETNGRAAALCGLCLQKGYGTDISEKEAFRWFECAAKNQDTVGFFWAGVSLLKGVGVQTSPVKGVDYLESAANQGNTDAMVLLALVYWEGRSEGGKELVKVDHPLAERYLRRAAVNGNAQGAYLLGDWYYAGIVVRPDFSQARNFYTKAAQAGLFDAKSALAELKFKAAKTPEERAAALEELRKFSAVSGRAAYVLGNIEPNNKKKIVWYQVAEAKKYAPAFFAHGKLLREIGKYKDGTALLDCAVALGDSEAMVLRGFEEAQSGRAAGAALEMLERAHRRGSLSAAVKLGRLYLQGRVAPRDERRAFEAFRHAAESDSSEAAYFLAICYKEGLGIAKKELEQAAFWAKKSADAGDSYGQLLYATMLSDGYGVKRDSRSAFIYLRKSVEQGNVYANKMLSDFLTKVSDLPEKESAEASAYVQRSAEKGDGVAALSLGKMYTKGIKPLYRDYELGFKNLSLAAKAGQVAAHALLADYYINGWGRKKDIAAALKELEAGRRAEDGDAFYKSGLCKLNGTGMKKDLPGAVKDFQKASQLGSADGELQLGHCKSKGIGGPVDAAGALKHYRKAAVMGNLDALFMQAMALKDGIGCSPNIVVAVSYLKKAAEAGNGNAMYEYGLFLANGVMVQKDFATALNWYRKAAAAGNSYGIYELARCYEFGRGVAKNVAKAADLYRLSAKMNNRYAQFCLGRCYEAGIGVPVNHYEAVKWYKKAEQNGFSHAGERLKALEKGSSGSL